MRFLRLGFFFFISSSKGLNFTSAEIKMKPFSQRGAKVRREFKSVEVHVPTFFRNSFTQRLSMNSVVVPNSRKDPNLKVL